MLQPGTAVKEIYELNRNLRLRATLATTSTSESLIKLSAYVLVCHAQVLF